MVWRNGPNELNSANPFESDGGSLRRILNHTAETTTNACNLAGSHPCASGEPPVFLFPAGTPFGMDNATLDAILFAFTTQRIDQDGDGIEDRLDPCPMDPADICAKDFFTGSSCPAGQVFCADAYGDLRCIDAFLCNHRIDANQDCLINSSDFNRVGGVDNGIQGTEAFDFGLSVGPFDP